MIEANEFPRESVTEYRLRKLKEIDETTERLEWEAKVAINNLRNYRREVEAELLRMDGKREFAVCASCQGSGLSLNMAGEPGECPRCKGNTVETVGE